MATIIGAHPGVSLIPEETRWFTAPGPMSWFRARRAVAFVRGQIVQGAEKVVEKTPRHVFRLSNISRIFPGARHIVMVRNPRSLVASLVRRFGSFDVALKRASGDYRMVNLSRTEDDVMVVRYEDMVRDLKQTLLLVEEFAGLQHLESPEQYYQKAPEWFSHARPSNAHELRRRAQMFQPISDFTQEWKNTLSPEEVKRIDTVFTGISTFDYPAEASPSL